MPSTLILMFHVNIITNRLILLFNNPKGDKVGLINEKQKYPAIYTHLYKFTFGLLVCFGLFSSCIPEVQSSNGS